MNEIDKICSDWDLKRSYWQELDKVSLRTTATIKLSNSMDVNGELHENLVGNLGMMMTEFKEFSDSTVKRTHPVVKGWEFAEMSELRKKRETPDYQMRKVFIPFDQVESIEMTNPIKPNEVVMTKTK